MKIDFTRYKGLFSVKLAAVIALCLITATSFVYSTMKKDIVITDFDGQKKISTFKNTVADVLEENNIEIKPYDKINLALTTELSDGLSISIQRAKMVTINADEKDTCIFSTAGTVGNVLKESGITLGEKDRIEPASNTAVTNAMTVQVIRVKEENVNEKVKLAFTNEVRKNDKLEKGLVKVVQKGKDGLKQVTTKITYENGKEVARAVTGENVITPAVNGIVEEGTKSTLVTSRGTTISFDRAIKMVATGYDAGVESCGKTTDDKEYGITYTGIRVRPGIAAVDPRVIPLGTWLYIEGFGEVLAADKGSAIKGNRIDLYFESRQDALHFGKKTLKVYVLNKPKFNF